MALDRPTRVRLRRARRSDRSADLEDDLRLHPRAGGDRRDRRDASSRSGRSSSACRTSARSSCSRFSARSCRTSARCWRARSQCSSRSPTAASREGSPCWPSWSPCSSSRATCCSRGSRGGPSGCTRWSSRCRWWPAGRWPDSSGSSSPSRSPRRRSSPWTSSGRPASSVTTCPTEVRDRRGPAQPVAAASPLIASTAACTVGYSGMASRAGLPVEDVADLTDVVGEDEAHSRRLEACRRARAACAPR